MPLTNSIPPNPALAGGEDMDALRRLAEAWRTDVLLEVPDEMLDPALVAGIPVDWARTNALLPIRRAGGVCLLLSGADALERRQALVLMLGEDLPPVLAPRPVILDAIERCWFQRRAGAEEFLRDMEPAPSGAAVRGAEDLLRVSGDAPISQLVNLILLDAVKERASDIHIEPFEDRLRVRFRIDGVLYERASPPKHLEQPLVSRLKVMAHMDIAEKRLPQDGMAKVRVGEREIDIRMSSVPVAEGERIVLRLLNRDASLLPLSALGMPAAVRAPLEELIGRPNGLVIVSGPTGSGKTTTLYAALGRVDTQRRNVLTIEDPIEYQLPDIGQIQVHPKIGLTFAVGLRHILRQDPDVVLVGEIRDRETADIAVRASLTGHLVFTTLHTNDAVSAVVRMMDIGVEPYLLAAALRGVMAQRLVRRLCPVCRRATRPTADELAALGPAGQALKDRPVWEPVGCPDCMEGYRGRIGLFELIVLDGDLLEIVRRGQGAIPELRRAARERAMRFLADDAVEKIAQGETALGEVLHVVGKAG